MKFTTMVAMVDPSYYVPMAQAAEAAGYASIGLADSICYPRHATSTYPYNADGSREFLENKPFIEPLIAAAVMGAATSSIRFHTAVMKLPIRNPVILAKEVTSLQAMIGGRFDLGVGTSPWREDYEVCGVPWAGRSRRFEEGIELVRRLSGGDYVGYDGGCYEVPEVKLNPGAPVRILLGGHSDAAIERAGRLGDGWIPAGLGTEELAGIVHRIDEVRRCHGREAEPFDVHAISIDAFSVDGVRRLEELGVTHVMGGFGRFDPYSAAPDTEPLQDKIDALNRYADDVMSHFAD
jgi:alkanesulfonate monooxygenase SsuD/methylene tetrahydromethanopterin reductase-like flavin-dependent oxidoreductase (luciferase family)